MDGDAVLAWCRARQGVSEERPFGPDVLVFKVGGKMFAACPAASPAGHVSLKCDPGLAATLRDRYPAVRPGYHLNKRHWNTVELDGSVPGDDILDMLEHSHSLVVASLPKSLRSGLSTENPSS